MVVTVLEGAYGTQLRAVITPAVQRADHDDGRDVLSIRPSILDEISDLLVSHPEADASCWALACRVGRVTQDALNLDDVGYDVVSDVVRVACGQYSSQRSQTVVSGPVVIRCSPDDVVIEVGRWCFTLGIWREPDVSFPWGDELRHDPLGMDPAEPVRRAVAAVCVGRADTADLVAELQRTASEAPDDNLAQWLGLVRDTVENAVGIATLRSQLAELLEGGAGNVWPKTFEERTRSVPYYYATSAFHEYSDDDRPAARAFVDLVKAVVEDEARARIAAAEPEAQWLTRDDGDYYALSKAWERAIRGAAGYDVGLFTQEEVRDYLLQAAGCLLVYLRRATDLRPG